MRAPRILFTYVLREVVQYTLLGLLAMGLVLVSQNLLRRLDELTSVGVTAPDVWSVFWNLLPMLAGYAVPISFLFGVLVAVGRLCADAELLALRANGLGLRVLLLPIGGLAVVVSALTGYLLLEVEHESRRALRATLRQVAARGGILEPGRFRGFGGRVVYVESREGDNQLRGVMISDRRDADRPFLVFAERGSVRFDTEKALLHIRLHNGAMHLDPDSEDTSRYQRVSFDELDYALDVSALSTGHRAFLRPNEMTGPELREVIASIERGESIEHLRERDQWVYAFQLHRRYALPVAPLLFALVAVPLGQRTSRSARSWGALLCGLTVFAYYALLFVAQYSVQSGWLSAGLALWLPNAAFAALGVWLLLRSRRLGG
ncbi:MAG: LptF/LptG family permease [Proteobacteria bacterium]|nr:LptF/LptG family permease [Pseudomonadota bacterium]